MKPWWGGYELRFKLIDRKKHENLKGQPEKLRINAIVTGFEQDRTFTVDFSKYEYIEPKVAHEFDHYTIYVYTPEMIVIEKLRAICQQMPEYPHRGRPAPRARDFYDIYLVLTKTGLDIASEDNISLMREIFSVKAVPLEFLTNICAYREFHRQDWPSVRSTVGGTIEDFDFYFDFVIAQVERLKTFGVV